MHFRTHIAEKTRGKSGGQGDYADGMVEHDEHVGMMLDKLDELGIADDTIVMYSTDNGPHYNSWPDAGITPFRSEKDTNWEGAWRVPAFVRWPGKFKAGTVLNGIVTHQDWAETLLAAAGSRTSRRSCSRATRSVTRPSRSISTVGTCCRISRVRSRKARGPSSSTSAMTET